jgi:hypothetical protein
MNENDLRDCFAMFKSMTGVNADDCYRFADEMLLARNKEDAGIVSIRKKSYAKKEAGASTAEQQ